MSWRRCLIWWAAASAALVVADPAHAFGPGVHSREAVRTLERLAVDDPAWGTLMEAPLWRSYLTLGAISPDLDFALDTVDFGHGKALSYHLIDQAAALGPEHLLFALGHLCHNASDASSEGFVVSTLFSSAPIGIFDAIADQGPERESEGLVEGFGDLMIGDWDTVVDALYDLYLDGDEARARLASVFTWYCETARAYLGRATDCGAALTEVSGVFDEVRAILGGSGREAARELVHALVTMPPDALVDLVLGGALDSVLSPGDFELGEDAARDVERVKETALMSPAFWSLYDEALSDLGPSFAIAFLATRSTDWPRYNGPAMQAGNLSSLLAFLPDDYDVQVGFLVDEVVWRDAAGAPAAALPADRVGETWTVSARFFSALPLVDVVRGVVRLDLPGLDAAADPIVGEATLEVAIDPEAYVTAPRGLLTVSFATDGADAGLGYTLELAVGDGARPTFTTSWDRLWTIDALEVDRPLYRDNFGTYGHWPPSLPLAEPSVVTADLFVKVRHAPAGTGIGGVTVSLDDGARERVTGPNGVACFDDVAPGDHRVSLSAPGHYVVPGELAATAPLREATWLDVALEAIPAVSTPAPYHGDAACLPVMIDAAPFGDQVAIFEVEARDPEGSGLGAPAEVRRSGTGELCFEPPLADGQRVVVAARARYRDGTKGVEGTSPVTTIDGSPPTVSLAAATDPDACVPAEVDAPWRPAATVTVTVNEPHSAVGEVRWRVGAGDWRVATGAPEGDAWIAVVAVEAGDGAGEGGLFEAQASNALGAESPIVRVTLPTLTAAERCETPTVADPDPDPEPDTTGATADPSPRAADGCSGGHGGAGLPL
ncbi:MAG: hypothetical protein EP329_05930, partial [Deltaproteobacteria bacterium]